MSAPSLAALIRDRRVIVCCGAGGVGKTTVSASLALAAARAGLRVVAITVDPSRRLAEALGVAPNAPAPAELSRDRLRAVGVEPPGSLAAWMLDPQLVCDRVVGTLSTSDAGRSQLLRNRVYQNVSRLIAGMQEYTAVEALHGFVRDDRYDLVVLDTPPSRNALRFLETPARANAFLDPRIFSFFIPAQDTALQRAGAKLINKILDLGLGRDLREELQQFLSLFHGVLRHLNRNQEEMRRFFTGKDVSFLLITSPAQVALDEMFEFERKTRELRLPLGGIILNQSLAWVGDLSAPTDDLLPADAPPAARSALGKLRALADIEALTVTRHASLAATLRQRVGPERLMRVLPRLTQEDADLGALTRLADLLTADDPPASDLPLPATAGRGSG